MIILRLFVISVFLPIAITSSQAQTKGFFFHLAELDALYEAKIKENAPNFRLIRNAETFPDRINATKHIDVTSKPVSGLVTLHDVQTGEPLQSCKIPCSLNVNPNSDYMLVVYKFGFSPAMRYVSSEQTDMDVWLGPDYLAAFKQRQECLKAFKDRTQMDRDAEPCIRVPAMMPSRAERSGHCKMKFDVTEKGIPQYISVVSCTDPVFEEASKRAVKNWFYYPKVERGQRVTRMGVETTIRFRLSDEEGHLIPE